MINYKNHSGSFSFEKKKTGKKKKDQLIFRMSKTL